MYVCAIPGLAGTLLVLRDLLARQAEESVGGAAGETRQRLATTTLRKLHASDAELQPFLGEGLDVSALRRGGA